MEKKLIKKEALAKLYAKLQATNKMCAPVVKPDTQVVFEYNPEYSAITFDHIQSTLSIKNVVFPRVENVLKYTIEKVGTSVQDIDVEQFPNLVLWGAHPCDTASYDRLKSIFCWDIDDVFFKKRLDKITIVGLSCHASDGACFCTSVGLSPNSTVGSDILLTKLADGNYSVTVVTEKGAALVTQSPELFEATLSSEEQVTTVQKQFDYQDVTKNLDGAFEHPFWVENSLRCIGCGACAFVCPTCACFDIQDEKKNNKGKRYRSWDSCCTKLFTIHTTGHNPREVQSQRWRQRIMHKFFYQVKNNKSLGCVGCGRCSRGCPVDMNISEQLIGLSQLTK